MKIFRLLAEIAAEWIAQQLSKARAVVVARIELANKNADEAEQVAAAMPTPISSPNPGRAKGKSNSQQTQPLPDPADGEPTPIRSQNGTKYSPTRDPGDITLEDFMPRAQKNAGISRTTSGSSQTIPTRVAPVKAKKKNWSKDAGFGSFKAQLNALGLDEFEVTRTDKNGTVTAYTLSTDNPKLPDIFGQFKNFSEQSDSLLLNPNGKQTSILAVGQMTKSSLRQLDRDGLFNVRSCPTMDLGNDIVYVWLNVGGMVDTQRSVLASAVRQSYCLSPDTVTPLAPIAGLAEHSKMAHDARHEDPIKLKATLQACLENPKISVNALSKLMDETKKTPPLHERIAKAALSKAEEWRENLTDRKLQMSVNDLAKAYVRADSDLTSLISTRSGQEAAILTQRSELQKLEATLEARNTDRSTTVSDLDKQKVFHQTCTAKLTDLDKQIHAAEYDLVLGVTGHDSSNVERLRNRREKTFEELALVGITIASLTEKLDPKNIDPKLKGAIRDVKALIKMKESNIAHIDQQVASCEARKTTAEQGVNKLKGQGHKLDFGAFSAYHAAADKTSGPPNLAQPIALRAPNKKKADQQERKAAGGR